MNVIQYDYENVGSGDRDRVAIAESEDFLQQIDANDVPYKGCLLTWCNGRQCEDRMYCKLDRLLCNEHWLSMFSSMEAEFLEPVYLIIILVWLPSNKLWFKD